MDLSVPCRLFSRSRLTSLQSFLQSHPDLIGRLDGVRLDAFLRLGAQVSHLRSRRAVGFYMDTFLKLEKLGDSPDTHKILQGALIVGSRHWAALIPYLDTAVKLDPQEDFFHEVLMFARLLMEVDIDVAVTFLKELPAAVDILGKNEVIPWGEKALTAVEETRSVSHAARAYLQESVANRCVTTPERWTFNLVQAARISERCPHAAEEFIRSGGRVCLLLDEPETIRWVDDGLALCSTVDELRSYFGGRSQKALEARDGLMTGIALKDRKGSIALICEAYLKRAVKIRSNSILVGLPFFSGGPATDGRSVFLPAMVKSYGLLKLMALHQATLPAEEAWWEELERGTLTPAEMHLLADRVLLNRLPGLIGEMRKCADREMPESYPDCDSSSVSGGFPWWGEILPHLVEETRTNVRLIREHLEEQEDVPPHLIEALMESVLSQGERDGNELLKRLSAMLDQIDFESPEAEDLGENVKTFMYKEWDMDLSDYKMDWVLVRRRPAEEDPNNFVPELRDRLHGIIALIRRQFVRLRPEHFKKYKAQPYGDDLDIDALVQAIVEARSGSSLSENIYIRRDKRLRDVAVLFLLDLSGSTEEKVEGKRIVDIQKEGMALMAEALDSLGDPFAVYGFSTEGRFRVDIFTVKTFNEPYGERVQYRLGNLEPGKMTRMGAVIRHATAELEKVQAKVKLMVIMTDGRPYDLEYGRLDYAVADTAKAFREARRSRIHPFIITSDQQGVTYLRRICSQTQSIILPRVELLPKVLPALYRRLTA